jgi:protein-S-isoprenylcysteine O-methyltransferase Ste14
MIPAKAGPTLSNRESMMRSKRAPNASSALSRRQILDLVERCIVLILFIYFSYRMMPGYRLLASAGWQQIFQPGLALASGTGAILLILSETAAVILIWVRRPAAVLSTAPMDWLLGFAGVSAALLVHPAAPRGEPAVALAHVLMISGLLLQLSGKLALWRSFGVVPANRGVCTRGPYQFVRHPIYAGYSLAHLGFLLGYFSLYNLVLYTSVLLIDIGRLLREEQILGRDPRYSRYIASVRYRLIPGVF